MVKYTGRGLVVKRPAVLSKVPDAESCLGGGGLFPSSNLDHFLKPRFGHLSAGFAPGFGPFWLEQKSP